MEIVILVIMFTGWVVVDEFWYLNETKGNDYDC